MNGVLTRVAAWRHNRWVRIVDAHSDRCEFCALGIRCARQAYLLQQLRRHRARMLPRLDWY